MTWRKLNVIGPECEINELGHIRQKVKFVSGVMHTDVPIIPARSGPMSDLVLSRCEGGVQKNYLLHMLVARTFLPNPKRSKKLRFKDGNRTHCAVQNLEWK